MSEKARENPTPVAQITPELLGPELKKPDLIDRIVTATGAKKKDVKPIVEATLAALGSALQNGEVLNLQPLGRVQIRNMTDKPNSRLFTCRIRQSKRLLQTGDKPSLARTSE